MEPETTTLDESVWRDSPSQWKECVSYIGAGFLLVAFVGLTIVSRVQGWPAWTTWMFVLAEAVPVLAIAWTFAKVATVQYELTNERIRETTGIISRNLEEIELYRVKDISVKRSPVQLALGLATIILPVNDESCSELRIEWVSDFREKHESIRTQVDQCRLRHRSRVVEFEGDDDFDGDLV